MKENCFSVLTCISFCLAADTCIATSFRKSTYRNLQVKGKKVPFSNELGALFIYNWRTYAMNPSMSSGLKQHSLCLYGRGNTDFSSLTSSLLGACLLSENKRKKRSKCIAEWQQKIKSICSEHWCQHFLWPFSCSPGCNVKDFAVVKSDLNKGFRPWLEVWDSSTWKLKNSKL